MGDKVGRPQLDTIRGSEIISHFGQKTTFLGTHGKALIPSGKLGSSHEEKTRSDQEHVSLLFTAQKGLQSHGRAAQTYPLVIKRGNGKSLMNKNL